MELRPYQKEAIDSIKTQWSMGRDKTLLILPTGTGKTICFSSIVNDVISQNGNPLIIAHRDELLEQASDKLNKAFGVSCDVKSIQSLSRDKNLNSLGQNHYTHIIIDEAHHCLSDSYQKVLNYFNSKVLGVTATPDRADKKNLGKYFDSIAYEYSMRQAIEDGYLCRIVAQMIPLEIDLNGIKVAAGDFDASDCADAIEPYMEQIATEMETYCKGRKTVVFLPLIRTSQKFVEVLKNHGFTAAEVNGNSEDRKQVLEDFDKGKYEVLCNSMLLTEGWDCPSVDCVIVLRPTKSRALFQQMVGRGTRLSEGKENLLLLDFLWNIEKHSLCRPSCLVSKSESITKKMDEKVKSDEQLDLLDIEEIAEKEELIEREQTLAKELQKQRFKKRGAVDPLQYAFSINVEDLVNYEPTMMWEMSPPTDKQLQTLVNFGIDATNIPNAGFASVLLDRCMARAKENMTSAKQIRFLEARGFKNVGTWKREEASSMISRFQANRWYCPRGVVPETYKPDSLR